MLASLVEGLRAVTVLLWPYLPGERRAAAGRAAAPRTSPWRRPSSARAGSQRVRTLESLFPKDAARRSERDRLPYPPRPLRGPDAELVAAAEAAGVVRILTVGIDGASCRAALAAAEDFPQVYAAIGRHPNAARGFDDADLAELRALAAHERCVAIGESGLDFYRERAPAADQERAFAAQIALARETGKPLVIHTRAAEERTLAQLAAEAEGVSVVMHCFSMPDRLEECLERGYAISFAGNVTYPSAGDLAAAASARPRGAACWSRPTRPSWPPRPCGAGATSRPSSLTRSSSWPSCEAVPAQELGEVVER